MDNPKTYEETIAIKDAAVKEAFKDDNENDYVILDMVEGTGSSSVYVYGRLYDRKANCVISATLSYIVSACLHRGYKVGNIYEAFCILRDKYNVL